MRKFAVEKGRKRASSTTHPNTITAKVYIILLTKNSYAMKRLFFISMLFLLGVACNKNEEIVTPKDSANEEKVEKIDEFQTPGDKVVTATEALTRAEEILSRFQTRSTPRVVKSCEYFVAKPATRSLADTIEVAFHLINYEDNAGFAMVAADERATDIYAYSDEGELTAADFEENPGLKIYKEIASEAYQAEVRGLLPPEPWPGDDPIGPITPTPNDRPNGILVQMPDGSLCIGQVTEDRSECLNGLLGTKWGQGSPYNLNLGGDPVGCAGVALSQIFTYHHHPASYNGYAFHWDDMEMEYFYNYQIGTQGLNDVATLIEMIHDEVDTGDAFGFIGDIFSGLDPLTFPWKIGDGISTFGYNSTDRLPFDSTYALNNLRFGVPLFIFGRKNIFDFSEAHYWVIDGFDLIDYDMVYYEINPPYLACGRTRRYNLSFHMNWGWGGSENGFYYLPNGVKYDRDIFVIYEITPNI